ncbi:helix-turn-helix domain-containing protein [Desulforamulus aquiferis]|uniref:Helix-turn-helix transcriptional regulator n=1 Tax=Desulforamulus aquiferis TaxID=1397668 RepID=A0AAW7Z8F6_9FIRM|nr:helix-turn-helix transcriptional regulator [Desulforamulus aquiferis]MDO7785712.1 helix-turn-helix transcriptional regulator [Desulforamulus aquiferis]RYD03345.1 hypothetical protein N752_21165 [Desulforamulus aquiferis]
MTENIRVLLGKNIRKIRSEKGLSQEELAFACGLHRTYISDIERGLRNVSVDNIHKIATALDILPMELLNFQSILNETTN